MNQNNLMLFVVIALAGAILFPFFKKIFRKIKEYIGPASFQQKAYLKDMLHFAITNSEMKKRLLITLSAIVVVQSLDFIILPGVDMALLFGFFDQQVVLGKMAERGIFDNLFERGRFSIFSLGLGPFLSSCLFLQIGIVLIPKLRKLFGNDSVDRRKMVKYTYVLTFILCILQSSGLASWMEQMKFGGISVVSNPGLLFRMVAILSLTAAPILLLFLASVITRYGLGNGVAIVIISSYLFHYLAAIISSAVSVQNGTMSLFALLLSVAILAGLSYFIYYVTNIAKAIILRKGEYKATIPMRTTLVGDIPISWGTSLGSFSLILLSLPIFGKNEGCQKLLLFFSSHVFVIITSSIFLVIATFIYALIVFNPKRIMAMNKKYGFLLNGEAEESRIDLDDKVSKVLLITGFFLLSMFLMANSRQIFSVVRFFELLYLLSIVGVFFDLVEQVKFHKDKLTSETKDWRQCEIAGDEIEAEIKRHTLKSQGIPVLIEPLRFSWGMPSGTIVDEYRIYVPVDKLAEAKNYLKG